MASEEDKNKSVSEQTVAQNLEDIADVTTLNETAPPAGANNAEVKAGTSSGGDGVTPGNLKNEEMTDAYKIAEATRGYDYQGKVYDEMISRLNSPETPEEKARREKKERSKKIIGAVSDGLRALGNLYFTSQYAPHSYNHEKGSQLNSTVAAIEKAKAEREKNDEAYYNLALKIGDLQNQRAKTVREMEAEAEARKIARQRAEDAHKKAEAERVLDPYRQDKAKNDALTSGYKSVTAQAEAEAAPEYYAGRNKLNDERAKTEGTKQKSYRAAAYEHTQKGKHAGDGSKDKDYFNVTDNSGNVHTISNRDLNDYYYQSDPEIREKHKRTDQFGDTTTPTAEQMRQVVTEHVATKGNTYRNSKKASPTGGASNKKKSPTS